MRNVPPIKRACPHPEDSWPGRFVFAGGGYPVTNLVYTASTIWEPDCEQSESWPCRAGAASSEYLEQSAKGPSRTSSRRTAWPNNLQQQLAMLAALWLARQCRQIGMHLVER